MPQYTATDDSSLASNGPLPARVTGGTAQRPNSKARGLTSDGAVRGPSNQQGRLVLKQELTARHIGDVTLRAGSNHDRPWATRAPETGRTRRRAPVSSETSMG